MIIYKITNKVNGKLYIGLTKQPLLRRWAQHIYCSNSDKYKNIYLYNAIRKYDVTNFIIEQIDSASSYDELCLKESYWINTFKSNNPQLGYNLTIGGEGICGFKKGPISNEIRQKISNSKKGKKLSDEHKEKLRLANIGKKMSIEAIEKSRIAHIGKKRSSETCRKIGQSKIGFKFTDESKKKISLNSKQKKPILQFDKSGTFIKEWESIAACCKTTKYIPSNISNCCSGKRASAMGFIWKFKSDNHQS